MSIAVVLVVFLVYVSTRDGNFKYERSGVIEAPVDQIFPYISNFQLGKEWSPYEQKDPNLKRTFKGNDGQVGSVMEFSGNSEAGSGSLEILKLVPNELVEIKLIMTAPIRAENLIQYRLTPEGTGTRFTWVMSGNGGFLGKLINVIMDCEKMVTKDFALGIENLKRVVESKKNP